MPVIGIKVQFGRNTEKTIGSAAFITASYLQKSNINWMLAC